MSTFEKTARVVFSVPRQLASVEVRRKALATLKPGDAVQAMDRETGEVVGYRLLTGVNWLHTLGWTTENWPVLYWCSDAGLPDWEADEDGLQVQHCTEHAEGGWILCRSWLSPSEVTTRMRDEAERTRKPPVSWTLWERHLEAVHNAILAGSPVPEEPWHND